MSQEELLNRIKRYRTQFIIAFALTLLIGGLGIFSDIRSLQLQNELTSLKAIKISFLYMGGTFSFCWCAFFLYYLDEWILSKSNNFFTRFLMFIYNIDIIKAAFSLLGGVALMFITFGIFGVVRCYLAWRNLQSLKKQLI